MSSPNPARLILAALFLFGAGVISSTAQDQYETGLKRYRDMLKADPWSNPGNLDVDRGEALWRRPGGPRNASLEACDLGLGSGVVDGAFAQLPRFFADADQVMDLEARLIWCMERLQGIPREQFLSKPHPAAGQPVKDLGAIAVYVASRSSGAAISPSLTHPRERRSFVIGQALFFRRQGPLDFSCASCHSKESKRIRRQELAQLVEPSSARSVIGEWPAYRLSTNHTMTMQHRIYDCYWQMRLPEVEIGSEATVALIMYMTQQAAGGRIAVPGLKR